MGRVAALRFGCPTAQCILSGHAVPLGVPPRGVGDDLTLSSLRDHGSLWCYRGDLWWLEIRPPALSGTLVAMV